jgi:hypothetical protein
MCPVGRRSRHSTQVAPPEKKFVGLSVHYRGSIANLDRVEDFEDRVIDLLLAIGGNVRLWRSADKADPSRMVRGLIVDLAAGQETTSLLLSPEGWLIQLIEIEDAEKSALTEPPWCSVKTQFGPLEGHVALIELLAALKSEFLPDLEVMDEGGYWEHRDLNELRTKMEFLGKAICTMAAALEQHPLTAEASESLEIVMARVERIAELVHRTLSRPAEHPPVEFPEDALGLPPDVRETEARWDALYRENRRRQERMERAIEERLLRGEDARDALEAATHEVVPPHVEDPDAPDRTIQSGETWNVSPWPSDSDSEENELDSTEQQSGGDFTLEERLPKEPNSLKEESTQLWMSCHDMAKSRASRSNNLDTLLRSVGEIVGGLAQSLPLPPSYEMNDTDAGLCLSQLKRSLRGAAFALSSLFLLRADESVDEPTFRQLADQIDSIRVQIIEHLRSIRESPR